MKISVPAFLLFFPIAFLSNCTSETDADQPSGAVPIDTLYVEDFEEIIATESAHLAQPIELGSVDDEHFVVLDAGMDKVITFTYSGEKMSEFGSTGSGPGEWGEMDGPSNLNYLNEQFLIYNGAQLKADYFTKDGEYISSIPFPQYMNYSAKRLINDTNILVTTAGNEYALAAILDLSNEGEIIQTVGIPVVEYSVRKDFEKQRQSYANGQIPDEPRNEALAIPFNSGFLLLMQTLGEIRKYDENGEMHLAVELPETVKKPIFNFVVEQNKDGAPHTVFPLEYALSIASANNHFYVLTPDFDLEGKALRPQLLVYNESLELQKHFIIIDEQGQSFLYDFIITPNGEVLFADVISARVLKTNLQ